MNRINLDFLEREIAADLHLPLNVVSKILEVTFLKILKHMMYNRPVRIKKFGTFRVVFRKSKPLAGKVIGGSDKMKAKMVPKLSFSKSAQELVEDALAELAERLDRGKK